jgi:hypothetical protein
MCCLINDEKSPQCATSERTGKEHASRQEAGRQAGMQAGNAMRWSDPPSGQRAGN